VGVLGTDVGGGGGVYSEKRRCNGQLEATTFDCYRQNSQLTHETTACRRESSRFKILIINILKIVHKASCNFDETYLNYTTFLLCPLKVPIESDP
jgi:hypothetical protein